MQIFQKTISSSDAYSEQFRDHTIVVLVLTKPLGEALLILTTRHPFMLALTLAELMKSYARPGEQERLYYNVLNECSPLHCNEFLSLHTTNCKSSLMTNNSFVSA